MDELTQEQVNQLVGGGDCQLHSHAIDREITHDQVLQFQNSENVKQVTSSRTVTYGDDFLFVDTSAGAVSLTLPIARGGKSYTIVRIAGTNNVTLTPISSDKINGATSAVISSTYAPIRIKALKGVGWLQV